MFVAVLKKYKVSHEASALPWFDIFTDASIKGEEHIPDTFCSPTYPLTPITHPTMHTHTRVHTHM